MIARPIIAVWFSCGAASAVAAKRTLQLYGHHFDVRVLNTPIDEEDADNRRFLGDVEKWLGVRIEMVTATWLASPISSAREVWERNKFMSGPHGAPCTKLLKKRARQQWSAAHMPALHVLGYTAGEEKRHARFHLSENKALLPVLIDAGISKAQCFRIIADAGIALPRMYDLGYPNANCIGCVKASSPTYWNHVRKVHPIVFADRAIQSRRIGAKLVIANGERVYLEDLDPNAVGAPMRTMRSECGPFCEPEP